jgi:hypothetical protein
MLHRPKSTNMSVPIEVRFRRYDHRMVIPFAAQSSAWQMTALA